MHFQNILATTTQTVGTVGGVNTEVFLNPIEVINAIMAMLSVVCATIAVAVSIKGMKMWRTKMISAAAFPALVDVLAKIRAYEDSIYRLLSEADSATRKLINNEMSFEEYRVLLKPIAEEKLPIGTLRDAGQLLELAYDKDFKNELVVNLLSEAKQIITPIRSWSNGDMLATEIWNWIEGQTYLRRDVCPTQTSLSTQLFYNLPLIQGYVSEIRAMAKQCAKNKN